MKRANGRGSVEVLPDGRARIRAIIDGKRRQVGPIYPNEEKATRMLDAWAAERDAGVIELPDEVTLGSYGEDWLDRREVHGSRSRAEVKSIRAERSVWKCHVAGSALAKLPLASIRARDVEDFAMELRSRKAVHAVTRGRGSERTTDIAETGRPLSRSMQREALRLVRACFDDAVRRDIVERNPAIGVRVAHGADAPRDLSDDWLRQPEIDRLLACEEIALRDRTVYACALGLALRLNDLKAIEVAHVHLDAEVPGPHVRVWIAKSKKWHRVPVMPWLVPWLRAHLATLPQHTRWLFPAPDGRRYCKDYDFSWAEHVDKTRDPARRPSALERAGVERKIRFHDLRGTCATHLALGTWGRRWSLHEIQSMLAHSDQRVTERYVRRALDTLAEAAAATPGSPGLPMKATGTGGVTTRNKGTPGTGLEPVTNRLTACRQGEGSREVTPVLGNVMGNADGSRVVELARSVLLAIAEGSPADEQIEALVEAVLASASDEVRLALAVRDGHPQATRRAIELAALLARPHEARTS